MEDFFRSFEAVGVRVCKTSATLLSPIKQGYLTRQLETPLSILDKTGRFDQDKKTTTSRPVDE
jgi:hypothetical protein